MTFTSRCMIHLRPALNKTVALSGLLAALLAAPAFADDLADVTRLVKNGQYADALNRADAFLSKNPRDAQMRFLKGVILTEQNRSGEAITVFTKLTEDYPALPEPYNNLAVLYAAAGQYEKARAALDAAIRTNPSYATAYENLGDVHAKLASQAYDKALQLDSANSAAKSKLTLVRSLVGNLNGGTPKAAAAPSAPAVAKAPQPAPAPNYAPAPVAPAPKVAAVTPAPAAPAKPAPVEAPAKPTVVAKQEPVKHEKPEPVKREPKPTPAANVERDDVLNAVHGWAKAWSAQDVKSYLNYYGGDFQTPNGQQRKAWEDDRRARIAGKGRISVKVESPQVAVNGNSATVKFRQVYVSDRLTANTRKTLTLTKHGGKWLIKQESTGN
ncbi:tetratricopeptide repeat protein [Noviherbaspirillum sp. UKPF54]|uniref:YybH family protein n=1 Tax=Noviherbaspirillum sp. UKPF54 TaxID=2601898 RepID=UPI0011B165ED|nr:tetratricopeptide repeat protein [Noviherbaspirillum sp. UKPF54]QDZ27247.1 tetratricopeptide repeat protein [Noviherbaspirillum sp. UKPF54]